MTGPIGRAGPTMAFVPAGAPEQSQSSHPDQAALRHQGSLGAAANLAGQAVQTRDAQLKRAQRFLAGVKKGVSGNPLLDGLARVAGLKGKPSSSDGQSRRRPTDRRDRDSDDTVA